MIIHDGDDAVQPHGKPSSLFRALPLLSSSRDGVPIAPMNSIFIHEPCNFILFDNEHHVRVGQSEAHRRASSPIHRNVIVMLRAVRVALRRWRVLVVNRNLVSVKSVPDGIIPCGIAYHDTLKIVVPPIGRDHVSISIFHHHQHQKICVPSLTERERERERIHCCSERRRRRRKWQEEVVVVVGYRHCYQRCRHYRHRG